MYPVTHTHFFKSIQKSTGWLVQGLEVRFNPYPPLQGIVERGEEALPIETALELFTRNGAISMNRLNDMGSIEAGKIANMIVLDRNLLEIPSNEIGETKVLKTILDGKIVFEQN